MPTGSSLTLALLLHLSLLLHLPLLLLLLPLLLAVFCVVTTPG